MFTPISFSKCANRRSRDPPTLITMLLAWQIASPQAAEHMQAGIAADKQRKFDVAIAKNSRKVTELDPSFADGFISLGQAYMESGDYGSAIPPLKHALELKPDLLPAHQLLGYALLAQGYASEAIPHLQRSPDKTALGIAQIQTGQLPEAVANLQAALAAHPNDPDLLYYLGRASGLLAKQSIDTLLAAYPDSARAHQAMAENYFVLRRMPDAEKEYREALRLRPGLARSSPCPGRGVRWRFPVAQGGRRIPHASQAATWKRRSCLSPGRGFAGARQSA
jgi:tetratricopeptide (TPR) repeat protein